MTTERIGWQDIPALRDAKDWIDGLGVDPVVTYRKDQVVRLIDRLLRQAEADIPPLPTKVPLALSSHDGEDMRVVFAQPDASWPTLGRCSPPWPRLGCSGRSAAPRARAWPTTRSRSSAAT